MSVLLEFAMFPTDKEESVSPYVSKIIKRIDEKTNNYQLTPMGTIVEFDSFEEATNLLNECYKVLEPDCNRVYSTATFDIRKGKNDRMKGKIASVEDKIGKVKH